MRTRRRRRTRKKRQTKRGGFGATISIVSTGTDSKQSITRGDRQFGIFPSQEIKEDGVMVLNGEAIALTLVDYEGRPIEYSAGRLFEVYDNIGGFYLCSKHVEEAWKRVAEECQVDLAVFNGEGSTVSKHMNESQFIEGLNILAGCSTSGFAAECNRNYNKHGKYFIGFDNYKHNYGTSFFTCPDAFDLSFDAFMEKYTALGDEVPIVKIIKIAHESFQGRHCGMLTLEGVAAKIKAVKPKMNGVFTNKDHYFESKYRIDCRTSPCEPDLQYETYIRNLCNRYTEVAAAKESAERTEKARRVAERERRLASGEMDKASVRARSKDGDDVTEYYKLILNEDLQEPYRRLVNGYLECHEPDIFSKIIYKEGRFGDYLEIIDFSDEHGTEETERNYYSFDENEPVNEKGGEIADYD